MLADLFPARVVRRACRAHREECVVLVMRVADVLVPTWRTTKKQYSARVYKFSLLCSGFASISGTTSGKVRRTCLYSVYGVATPLNTCGACSACHARHDERVVPCCPTSAARTCGHVTSRIFPNPHAKKHGLDSDSVSWRAKWNLGNTECIDGVGSWQNLRCESGILQKTHGILSSRYQTEPTERHQLSAHAPPLNLFSVKVNVT